MVKNKKNIKRFHLNFYFICKALLTRDDFVNYVELPKILVLF